MITVTLENKGNMLRTELPKPIEDLFDDLGSIGIRVLPNTITFEDDSPYNIRLYSDSVLGQAVIERLTERDDLAALNSLCGQLYKGFDDAFKAEIIGESNARGVHDLLTLFGTDIPLDKNNKAYIKERLAKEQNEAVRKLLEANMEYLDSIQVEMSTARQFLFAVRFRKEKESFIFNHLNEIGKVIKDNGFIAHRLDKAKIKRMLALYFGTSITGDMIEDVEGEEMIMKGVNDYEGETEKLSGE